MAAVHQFVPTFEPSAVGTHILEVRRVCRDQGWESEIFAEHVRPVFEREARSYRDYGRGVRAGRDDVLLYHVAIGSTVADFVAARPEVLVLDHHNITPVEHFAGWEPDVVHGLAWGRRQLAQLARRTTLGIADSAFNEAELVELGYGRTAVAPIILDTTAFGRDADADALGRLATDDTVLLFVSRVAPNKRQHDLVKALAAYRRAYDPHARLRIVGPPASARYVEALRRFVADLGLAGSVDITGAVSDGELAAHYRTADVYLCLSEHEGFGLTVLEALHHRLPVVAYASAAVPETLGDGGLCLPVKDAATVAAAVHRVVSDAPLRAALVDAGTRRLRLYDAEVARGAMRDALCSVVG